MEDFIREGIATEEHRADIRQRERIVSFAFRPDTVFLYTQLPSKETKLSFVTLKHRITWNDFKISFVIAAMIKEEDRALLFHLKNIFCTDDYDIEPIRSLKTRDALLPFLEYQ